MSTTTPSGMPDEPLPTYRDVFGVAHPNPWVSIVFITDADTDATLAEFRPADGWTPGTIAAALTRWDVGDESDAANTSDVDPRTSRDRYATVTEHKIDGLTYWLTVNAYLDDVVLTRRPLDWTPTGFAHGGDADWCDTCNAATCVLF